MVHVTTTSKIKTRRILTVVGSGVQNVEIRRVVINHQIALAAFATTIYVAVSIELLLDVDTSSSLTSAAQSCGDGIKNQDETDIDCGGITCPKCGDTKGCNQSSDCISGFCNNHICGREY